MSDVEDSDHEPMNSKAYVAFAAAWRDTAQQEPWKRQYEKKKKYLLVTVKGSVRVAVEELAEKIASRRLSEAYAICALHVAYENMAFLQLMMRIGGGPELIQYHNVWVLSQVEKNDPYTFEKWGDVLHLLPHPIMPFDLRSYRLVEYNDKLYEWAFEQKTAGAGGPDHKRKAPDFLIFATGPSGGNGPYLPVEMDGEGRPQVNGANLKFALDQQTARHELLQEQAATAVRGLEARLAETERAFAEFRAQVQQQPQTQQVAPPQQFTPPPQQQYAATAQQHQQQYAAPQQQYAAPQQQYAVPQQQYSAQPGAYMPPPMVAYMPHPQYPQQYQRPWQPRAPPRGQAPANRGCDRCGAQGHIARNCTARLPRGGEEGANPQ
jgi:hypothetical protein